MVVERLIQIIKESEDRAAEREERPAERDAMLTEKTFKWKKNKERRKTDVKSAWHPCLQASQNIQDT